MDDIHKQAIATAVAEFFYNGESVSETSVAGLIHGYLRALHDTRVRKKSGSNWHGRIVGFYCTTNTRIGYAVESEREVWSVQIYPASALEVIPDE